MGVAIRKLFRVALLALVLAMVQHKRAKHNRKLRGKVSAGYGRIGKHRKHSGGQGKAGLWDHKRTSQTKYHPGLYGKLGIRRYNDHSGHHYSNAINLEQLAKFVPENVRSQTIAEGAPVPKINLTNAGYTKVLSQGSVGLKMPLIVICESFSKSAQRQIEKMGGVALTKELNHQPIAA